MKNKFLIPALAVCLLSVQSCKKDEDSPVAAKTYKTNVPPASGYHYAVYSEISGTNTQSSASWTTDGKVFSQFTNQFLLSATVNICNDKIVIQSANASGKFEISFADVGNLKNFKKVTTDKNASEIAILNDVVIATAVDGSNFYYGFCDTEAGETSMTYNLLPAGTFLSDLKVVGNKLIAQATGFLMCYSLNGKDLVFTSSPLTGAGNYEYIDGKTYLFSGTQWASTTDDDLSAATWDLGLINNENTTDTFGSFIVTQHIIPFTSEWRVYGSIYSSFSGKHYPCVNISQNKGVSWTTHFLTGISSYTNNNAWSAYINAFESNTILNHYNDGSFEEGIYSSENGIDFTKWTNQSEIDAYRNNFLNVKSVK